MWATFLLLFSSCGDNGITVFNSAPEVTLLEPAPGAIVAEGAPVRFVARVSDAESELDALELQWTTGFGPLVGAPGLTEDGDVTLDVDGLPVGGITVTLTVIDPSGDSDEDAVDLTVIRNLPPELALIAPEDHAQYVLGAPVTVRVEVDDERDPPEDLQLTWGGAAAVPAAPARANGDGVASFVLSDLPAGTHTVSITVTDGFGDSATAEAGFVVTDGDVDQDGFTSTLLGGTDCDDGDELVFPGAPELCNEVDDDCNTFVDEPSENAPPWYLDDDEDGYGDPDALTRACDRPAGHVANDDDCDDSKPEVNPIATERCNGWDDDCDGTAEVDAVDRPTWYLDRDGDSYGDPSTGTLSCTAPSADHVRDNTDCDDTSDQALPGGVEVCDGLDNDCNTQTDEPNPRAPLWYRDFDNDTWGNDELTVRQCGQPSGYVGRGGDCDDQTFTTNPGAPELCNGVNDDCADGIDEDPIDIRTWYRDVDNDTYGNPNRSQLACDKPAGWVADDTDCNDGSAVSFPGAPELCDGLDNDCDRVIPVAETTDRDGDGVRACNDCDDRDASVKPGAPERCNGVDDDCDGAPDEGAETCECPVVQDAVGRTYLFCEGRLNWGGAFDFCDERGYELLSVSTSTQTQFVRDTIAAYPWQEPPIGDDADDAWWTAGNRPINSGADCSPPGPEPSWPWEWADGTPWTYVNWRFDEPNNLTGCEGCVEVWFDGGWNDEDCGVLRNWICELED